MNTQYTFLSKFLNEIHGPKINPNVDMLIQKPSVYLYVSNDILDKIQDNGIPAKGNRIKVYFSRFPESNFPDFTSKHTPIKISTSKLKRIKDQMVKILPVNVPDANPNKSLTDDEILKLNTNSDDYVPYYEKGDMDNVPHAEIHLSTNMLPAFVCKFQE
jgi:hypothetical protein